MAGLEYSHQQCVSQLNSFYHSSHTNRVRDLHASALMATVTDDALTSFQKGAPLDAIMLKDSWSPFSGYHDDAFVTSVSVKAAKVPAPSPTTSFKVHTAEDAPVLELPPCPPCNVAAEEPEAVDVFPRTSAPPCVLTADELLGGSPPVSACAEGAAVAYRNEAQQLAWARGKLLTWAAVARQQQQQQWDSAAAPAGPVEIDDKWNFTFVCLEAAAKVGMRTTYAMAAAGAC